MTTARTSENFIPLLFLTFPVEPGVILEPEAMDIDTVPNTIDMLVIKTGYRVSSAGRGC